MGKLILCIIWISSKKMYNLNGIIVIVYNYTVHMHGVGGKWFMGQAHLPRENPKAQAGEDYGPSSTR